MKLGEKTAQLWGMEPARLISLIGAILILIVSYALPLEADLREAIIAIISTAVMMTGGEVIRHQVAPRKKVEAAMGMTAMPRIQAVKKEEIGTSGTLRAG